VKIHFLLGIFGLSLAVLLQGCSGPTAAESAGAGTSADHKSESSNVVVTLIDGGTPIKVIDLGETGQADSLLVPLSLQNRTKRAVEISRISASCPCVSVELENRSVASGESLTVSLRVDLTSEPNFVGDLVVTVDGYEAVAGKLFELSVLLHVRETPGIVSASPVPEPMPFPPIQNSKSEGAQ